MEYCEVCEEETEHYIIKQRGRQFLIQCSECGNIKTVVVDKEIDIVTLVSDGETTLKKIARFPQNQEIVKDTYLFFDEIPYLITKIETKNGPVNKAFTQDIWRLWLKKSEYVQIRFVIVMGDTLKKRYLVERFDRVFTVGESVVIDGQRYRITSIFAQGRRHRKGSFEALYVSTVYVK